MSTGCNLRRRLATGGRLNKHVNKVSLQHDCVKNDGHLERRRVCSFYDWLNVCIAEAYYMYTLCGIFQQPYLCTRMVNTISTVSARR